MGQSISTYITSKTAVVEPLNGSYPTNTCSNTCYACLENFMPCSQASGDLDKSSKQKLCTNLKCAGFICNDCIKIQYYLPINHRGYIDRSKVLCGCCQSLIDPSINNVSDYVKNLFDPSVKYNIGNEMIANNAAEMLKSSYWMWQCDSFLCKDNHGNGVFCVPKVRCGENNDNINDNVNDNVNVNEKKYCQKCIEYDIKNNLSEWKQRGFDTEMGLPCRLCPGCGERYERVAGTCPRLYCSKCITHFCYCCEKKFVSAEKVYEHLDRDYGTKFPTNDMIHAYLDRRKKIEKWGHCLRKSLQFDITDKEIEIIIDDYNVLGVDLNQINKVNQAIHLDPIIANKNIAPIRGRAPMELTLRQEGPIELDFFYHLDPQIDNIEIKNQDLKQEDKKENVIKQTIQLKQSNPQENPKKRTKEEKQRINQERRAKINEHIKNAPPSVKHNWNHSSTHYNMENRTRIRELKKRQSIENKVMKRRNKAYLKHMR